MFGVRFSVFRVLQCVAVCCSALQCVAVCRSVLQCVTVRCSMLHMCRVGFFSWLLLFAPGDVS